MANFIATFTLVVCVLIVVGIEALAGCAIWQLCAGPKWDEPRLTTGQFIISVTMIVVGAVLPITPLIIAILWLSR